MGQRHAGAVVGLVRPCAFLALGALLAGCASSDKFARAVDPRYGVASSPRVVQAGDPIPKGGGTYRVGKPYMVGGQMYVPEEDVHYRAEGLASWYGDDFHGRRTANGEIFDMDALSAAHPTLPMPSYVRVTNLQNGKSVIVRVNDRGPYRGGRLIDVSHKTARVLGFHNGGVAKVRVEYVGSAPLEGSDDRMLMATLRQNEPAPVPSAVRVASARPFVPQFETASTAVSGEVPLPPERPFNLGEGDTVAAASPSDAATRVARSPAPAPRSAALRPRTLDAQAVELRSVASYQPAREPPLGDGPAALSARGLY